MISKAELLAHARSVQLTPEVVEKDYVLGWLLSAIAHHPETRTQWVFKGGTCLKKCVVETWRFSEDLDFSLTPDAAYTAEQLTTILRDVASRCHDSSGLVFPGAGLSVRKRRNREPYALRRPKTGNLLLYAHERSRDGVPTDMIKAYKIHEIGSLRVLQTAFQPRYAIELYERPGAWRW